MLGINEDILDRIIKTNNVYLESIEDYKNSIIDSINDLENSYEGRELDKILNQPYKQVTNIKKVIKVIYSYNEVLKDVKIAYKKQNSNIRISMKHESSKLN